MWKAIAIILLWCGVSMAAGVPLPTSSNVQRITPASCPVGTIPIVNSQGTAGAAVSVASASTKVIPGNGSRVVYSFECTANTLCEYGTSLDVVPATTPTSTVGMLYQANTLYWEDVYPGNRMDCITASGADVCYTTECVP